MRTVNLIEGIYFTALDKKIPAERLAYLDEACKGDDVLRRCVERMLDAEPKIGNFLQPNGPATIEPSPIEERPGTIIGSYKLLQQLGEGGFGVVFMAEQEQPVRRKVALKIIKPGMDSKQVVARFEAERQALALMDHPNIARVFDGGTTDSGRPYFVMELVKGTPITEFCDKHRLTPRERLELFIPVCQAVQHAHQKGIIHRDIKPSNVLITMYDDKPVPKVIDFGIAKAIAEKLTEQTLFTRVGQVIGTLEYMSPEQASLNALDVDTRADVYALGVLLYELLTGSTPLNKDRIQGVAFLEMLRLIREEEPPKPSTRLSQSGDALTSYAVDRRSDRQKLPKLVKGELDWITMKALEKDRTRRYDSASAMAADVQRYLKDEQVEACPPSISYRFQKYARKHKTAFAMTSITAALLLFGIAATGWQALRAMSAEDQALANEKIARDERDATAAANVQLHDAQDGMRRTLYYARSNLLQNAWDGNNLGQVFELLDQQRPGKDERDLRDFEWHYRDRMCHQDLLTITGLGGDRPVPIPPAFSPDGKFVVAQAKQVEGKPSFGEIAIYRLADGSERTRLKLDTKRSNNSLQWTPDSKRILVIQQSGGRVGGPFTKTPTAFEFVVCDAEDGHEISRAFRTEDAIKNKGGGAGPFGMPGAAFSPDGKYYSILPWDGTGLGKILVCDTTTGKVFRTFGDPSMRPYRCAFSPDGSRFAAAIQVGGASKSPELEIRVWDTLSGEELFSKNVAANFVGQIHFSPDGNRLAFIGFVNFPKQTSAFTAWDLTNGKEVSTFLFTQEDKGYDGKSRFLPTHFVFSPDMTRLAHANPEGVPGEIRVYDTATGEVVEKIRHTAIAIFSPGDPSGKVQFSPDGKMLAVGGSDATVCVWDLGAGRSPNGAPAFVLRGHTSEVRSVGFHPDGSRLFSAGADGMVKVWDIATRDRAVVIENAVYIGNPFAFSATSGRILAVFHPRHPQGLGPKTAKDDKGTSEKTDNPANGVTERSTMTLWDLNGKQMSSFAGPIPSRDFSPVQHPIALSPDGTRLAIISILGTFQEPEGNELHVIETDTGKELFMRKVEKASPFGGAIAFSRDGKQIAWSVAVSERHPDTKFPIPTGPVHVKLLNSTDGAEIRRISLGEGSISSLAFNPDGTRLAVAMDGSGPPKTNVSIWDVRSGERLVELKGVDRQSMESLVFSDDGTRLAGIVRSFGFGAKNDVFIWDAATGKTLFALPGHSGPIVNIAFSPNGRRIATATMSGSRFGGSMAGGNEVKLWDAATGNELMTLKDLDRNSIRYLSFSADGTRLYAVGTLYTAPHQKIELRTWDATPRETK